MKIITLKVHGENSLTKEFKTIKEAMVYFRQNNLNKGLTYAFIDSHIDNNGIKSSFCPLYIKIPNKNWEYATGG